MIDLSTTYMGFQLKNPIIAASSGLTGNIENIKELEEAGVSAIVLKSIFEEEIRLETTFHYEERYQKEKFIYPESSNLIEAEKTENTLNNYRTLLNEAKKSLSIPIIASINCMTSDKWIYFAKSLEEFGADAIELNIFLLPSDVKRIGKVNERLHYEIIEEVLEEVNIPVSIKIGYYNSQLAHFIKALSETGIKGIVLFNRAFNADINIEHIQYTAANKFSHPQEIVFPLRWISLTSDRVSCDIAASTGIHDGSGVIKMLLAGASAVQVASTLYLNGIQQVSVMLNELSFWMKEKRYEKIKDFKGLLSCNKLKNPAINERVQFMKYFAGK
ncbi:dihydroorotate dehydrogenase-like protein [Bacteroidota bacterium]